MYQRIKEKYFDGNYIPEAQFILFTWKKGKRNASWCSKDRKEIRIGGAYKEAFNLISSNKIGLVKILIHEAIHLRLPHHRKHFKEKENEIVSKVKVEHIDELFKGLLLKEVSSDN